MLNILNLFLDLLQHHKIFHLLQGLIFAIVFLVERFLINKSNNIFISRIDLKVQILMFFFRLRKVEFGIIFP
jgi:hypothetical protein